MREKHALSSTARPALTGNSLAILCWPLKLGVPHENDFIIPVAVARLRSVDCDSKNKSSRCQSRPPGHYQRECNNQWSKATFLDALSSGRPIPTTVQNEPGISV